MILDNKTLNNILDDNNLNDNLVDKIAKYEIKGKEIIMENKKVKNMLLLMRDCHNVIIRNCIFFDSSVKIISENIMV